MLPVIKHNSSAQTITIPVRKKVAKSEFMPIFAKIVVRDVAKAPTKARFNHNIKFKGPFRNSSVVCGFRF